MKKKKNKTLLKILLYSIIGYLMVLPIFYLQVNKPKDQYLADNYTLISFYNQGTINKSPTNLRDIELVNQTIGLLSKKFNTNTNKINQKENSNIFVAFNESGSFVPNNSNILNLSSVNKIFTKNYNIQKTETSTGNKNSSVVKNIKMDILNIVPENVKNVYSAKNNYNYVSYVNENKGGITLIKF